VTAADVIEVVDRLEGAGLWYCVEGGWGVDALLGEQTRTHGDLDLGVRMDGVDSVCAALGALERDDEEWPSSLVLHGASARHVDCHPLTFDENGDGWQAGRDGERYLWPHEHLGARGRIGDRTVRCVTVELQLRWHAYEGLDDIDWADMRALCARFGLAVPAALVARPGFVAGKRRSCRS
jgi:lincosamide nucleotidyltransferase A/C/D/E